MRDPMWLRTHVVVAGRRSHPESAIVLLARILGSHPSDPGSSPGGGSNREAQTDGGMVAAARAFTGNSHSTEIAANRVAPLLKGTLRPWGK